MSAAEARALDLDGCGVCGGLGYLVDQSYGACDLPDGAVPVQRCDECQRWAGDDDAAAAYAASLDGPAVVGFGFAVRAGGDGREVADLTGAGGDFWVLLPREGSGA